MPQGIREFESHTFRQMTRTSPFGGLSSPHVVAGIKYACVPNLSLTLTLTAILTSGDHF
jgi:hypothetical protein